MKSIHFCTKQLIDDLMNYRILLTYRTIFIPRIYPKEIIKLKIRINGVDKMFCNGLVLNISPTQFKNIGHCFKTEINEKFKNKFNPEHWFFEILIDPIREGS
ncbi:MAG: hypothetical protein [Lokiarchaeia virus VerdaV1]|uniref:Uncharacterized protein n=1 Tax=Lokiarchaeia virus VerdaV1 TaxID=3070170 RepID=A0AA35GAH2_9CAUD|nr:MAG: hypothetical protein QIT41_gp39 [Lokiarchaeia virus VerdaV1]BDI54888.1 MAG: hypothetical protein [Lokiarchaeia virus VerdaV1]